MARGRNNGDKTFDMKKKYVLIAIRIMENEGFEAVNNRKVAKEAGCTSAVLYRHFDNKQDLMMTAAVKFLQPYIKYLAQGYTRDDLNFIQINLGNWKVFIEEAFNNKPCYDLFFSRGNDDSLYEYILEYYRLFPSELIEFDGYTGSITMNTDLRNRELIALRRAANAGLISMRNSDTLSRLSSTMFYGMFGLCPSNPGGNVDVKALKEECFNLIYELYSKYVNPDTDMSMDWY